MISLFPHSSPHTESILTPNTLLPTLTRLPGPGLCISPCYWRRPHGAVTECCVESNATNSCLPLSRIIACFANYLALQVRCLVAINIISHPTNHGCLSVRSSETMVGITIWGLRLTRTARSLPTWAFQGFSLCFRCELRKCMIHSRHHRVTGHSSPRPCQEDRARKTLQVRAQRKSPRCAQQNRIREVYHFFAFLFPQQPLVLHISFARGCAVPGRSLPRNTGKKS